MSLTLSSEHFHQHSRILRHPSYFGWFYWSIGTSVIHIFHRLFVSFISRNSCYSPSTRINTGIMLNTPDLSSFSTYSFLILLLLCNHRLEPEPDPSPLSTPTSISISTPQTNTDANSTANVFTTAILSFNPLPLLYPIIIIQHGRGGGWWHRSSNISVALRISRARG